MLKPAGGGVGVPRTSVPSTGPYTAYARPMRKSRFTESQIVAMLEQGDVGMPIAEIQQS
jgi:hypothetical protein